MWVPPRGQTDGWMDRHVSKHYLPVVLRTRAVINDSGKKPDFIQRDVGTSQRNGRGSPWQGFHPQKFSTFRIFLRTHVRNKKVLLRERKRHTDCGVSSTPSVVLPGEGGTPGRHPPGWGTPNPDLAKGLPWVGPLAAVPPIPTWLVGTPGRHPLAAVPLVLTWLGGYPRWASLAGVPPHPDQAGGGFTLGEYPLAGVTPS